jgi:protein-S-isoprenylcysteine O-methyltransferase Ste14
MTWWLSPAVAFAIAGLAMWWVGRDVDFGHYAIAHQRAVGVALIVIGLIIVALGLRSFEAVATTPNPTRPEDATKLVTSGIYSFSRNPMYVGDAIMLAGIAVWAENVLNLVPLAAFIAYIDRFQIAAEEVALAEKFGDRYTAYCRKVRRWL